MSLYSNLYGSGSGAPIGAIIQGAVSPGGDWLKLDGSVYNKADYSSLDTSCMLTVGSNSLVTRQTLTIAANKFAATSTVSILYNESLGSTTYFSSTDGITWTSRSFPANFSAGGWKIAQANNVFFGINTGSSGTTIYTSTDGVAWTSRTLPSSLILGAVGYVNGYYVIPTSNNSQSGIYSLFRSTDLATWTLVTVPTYTSGSENHVFSPANLSLYTDPVRGLSFGIQYGASAYNQLINTRNGIDYSSINLNSQRQGAAGAPDYYQPTSLGSVFQHNDGAFVTTTGSLFSYTGSGLQPQYSDLLYLQSKNLTTTLVTGVNNYGLSEDFGRTCKLGYGVASVLAGAVFNNKIITCGLSNSIVRTIDIDTTKFAAVYPAFTPDVSGNFYIKAR